MAAIVATLAVSLLAVAFLLGREWGRAGAPSAPPAAGPAVIVPPPPASVAAPDRVPPIEWTPPPVEAAPAPAKDTPVEERRTEAPPSSASADTRRRDEVSRYFLETESLQSQGKYWSDPQELAKALVEQAGKGDTSGFDRLIEANRRVHAELERMSVPDPCAEHHRLTLALMEEGVTLVTKVRDASVSGNAQGLELFTTAGHDIEARTRQVDDLAAEIKRRFGIAP